MDFLTGLKISSSALKAQRTRMGAISSNIANAQTTRTPEGGTSIEKKKSSLVQNLQENLFQIFLKGS